jgi:hypothetical protein
MVNYKCPRCGYEINIKTKYVNHLRRKKLCNPVVSEDDLQNEYIKFNVTEKILSNNTSVNIGKKTLSVGKTSVNIGKTSVNIDKNSDSESSEIEFDKSNKLVCKYCNKKFLRKDYLENHLKKSCKMLKEFNNIYNFNKNTFGKNIYKGCKNAGDIYIIQTDYVNNDHFKIGITNNIQSRLASYRCGNTYEPRLYYYISCEDIRLIDSKIKFNLRKFNVKREIFKGNVDVLKDIIVKTIKKEFKITEIPVHEPDIKIGDLSECSYCNKCFYNSKDLFEHFNTCENYKENLSKDKINKKYECNYCYKCFSKSSNLTRHLKTCKKKKEDDEEKQNLLNLVNTLNKQLEKRDKQIEEQNNQINELIKKAGINIGTQNIQQNIQQNIKILAYNNTDLSHLTDKDYLKCLKHSNFCIPHLIQKIHFNPKKPENHNIYISNLKNNYVMIYNGNKWMINDREESIQNLIDEKESIIEQKLEEWIENGEQYPDIMKKFNRYLEKRENDKVLNKIKSEIKMMLFNNRDIVSTK